MLVPGIAALLIIHCAFLVLFQVLLLISFFLFCFFRRPKPEKPYKFDYVVCQKGIVVESTTTKIPIGPQERF